MTAQALVGGTMSLADARLRAECSLSHDDLWLAMSLYKNLSIVEVSGIGLPSSAGSFPFLR